ncbi:MAG: sulfite exporter TauE/SafE family protein [Nitrososphaerales archaeon]
MIISVGAGILGTVSGGGGGSFVVPAIVTTIHESPQVLVGSVFLMYFVSSITGLYVYYKKKLVDVRTGILLSIPTIPGVLLGTVLETSISSEVFRLALGTLVAVLGFIMYTRPSGLNLGSQVRKSDENKSEHKHILTDSSGRVFEYTPNFLAGIVINFTAGVLNGLFGAGAAIIIIPATILFVKIPGHVAIASTRIVLSTLNGVALLAHITTGAINDYYAVLLAIGAAVGTFIGARIAFRASKTNLTKIVSVIFFMIGIYLVVSSL